MVKKKEKVERVPGQIEGKGFSVRVDLYGLPAYAVDQLLKTGLYGTTRKQVVEELARQQIRREFPNWDIHGITPRDAEERGYTPIKFKED
jgi:hypothetical protein